MITNRARPGHDRALTRAEREFLEQLLLRDNPTDPNFIFSLPRGRQGFIARMASGPYEVMFDLTKNQSTIDGLEHAGLITVDSGRKLPKPFGPGGYGYPIAITQLGRETIG